MSDKQEVIKKAKNYLGADVKIKQSTRKGKKFMVENPFSDKYIMVVDLSVL